MGKKLLFLLIFFCMLAGCGASSAPDMMSDDPGENQSPGGQADEYMMLDTADFSVGGDTAPGEGESMSGGETAPPEAVMETGGEYQAKMNYFTFSRGSEIAVADDGTELLYEYTCDTEFVSLDPELQGWVDQVLAQIREDYASNSANLLQYAQESLELGGTESFYGYSNYQELGIARHDSKVVSLVVLSSVYSGGTHPNTVQTAWNLDMERCRLLTLQELILPDAAGALADLVKQQVEDKFQSIGSGALFDDYEATIENAFSQESMTPYWYLNDQGLVIFFNQYALGPYAAGIIKTVIPYQSLEGILREEYFPGQYGLLPGDLLLRGDWEGYRKIPVTLEAEGERLLIGVEGEVYQVQLSQVSWLEGTAIGQKMLFSANCMTQNDVIELVAAYDDESSSLAVEFVDGQGNATLYYIHPEGLTTQP